MGNKDVAMLSKMSIVIETRKKRWLVGANRRFFAFT